MTYEACESFIQFCDDMMIANEAFNLSRIKTFLKNMILKALRKAENFFKKIKNEKIRNILVGCTKRLRGLLGEVDQITPETKEEKAETISEECESINKEIDEAVGKDDPEVDNIDDRELKTGEDIKRIKRSKAGKSTYYYENEMSEEYADAVYDVAKKMDKATTFQEYIGYFKEFKRMLQLPDKCTVYGLRFQGNGARCYYIVENKRPMKVDINKALYHTSENPNLTEITPNWRAERDDRIPLDGRFFDSPRAFFGVYPMNRMGGLVKKDNGDRSIYKVEGIRQAFIDTDGINYGKSVYVESMSPIRLSKVN